ncbi:spore germination protein [Bacillus cereus]|uniref:Spore germination protein n=2 Tax=Bacillus cereus TaxID=1396 RepID=A0A9X7GY09_BACCE|nr:spore germination protein [Bacillus cereus]
MYITKELNHTADLKQQLIQNKYGKIMVLYISTIINKDVLQEKVISSLLQLNETYSIELLTHSIPLPMNITSNLSMAIDYLIDGSALLFINGMSSILAIDLTFVEKRNIVESTTEKIIKGAHDGFIENLDVNINLIRKRIKSPDLTIEYFTIGEKSKSKSALLYIKDIAELEVINEIKNRIHSISTSFILPSSYIEECIQDSPISPFPQILNTERPDRAMSNLLEGRAIFLEDNNPNALIMPVNFFSFYQSPDDYNSRWLVGSFFRLIRLISFFIAISLPAIYIAVIGFHFEVLPNELILPIKNSITGIPYPPLLEALIMELTLELIREAGIRLPTTIGQTIGIVGGLVIGDAIVKAGFISNTMVIVVALTAIASFIVPSSEMSNSIRLLRFCFMIAAATIGFLGITCSFMILIIHLCKLESFGRPYFFPVAPLNFKGLKDTIIRKKLCGRNKE